MVKSPYKKTSCCRDPILSGIGPVKPQPTRNLKMRKHLFLLRIICHTNLDLGYNFKNNQYALTTWTASSTFRFLVEANLLVPYCKRDPYPRRIKDQEENNSLKMVSITNHKNHRQHMNPTEICSNN